MRSKDFSIESKEFPEISLRIVAADLIVEGICWRSDLLTRKAFILAVPFVNPFLWGMIESVYRGRINSSSVE